MIPDKLRIDYILKSTAQIADVVSRPKDVPELVRQLTEVKNSLERQG